MNNLFHGEKKFSQFLSYDIIAIGDGRWHYEQTWDVVEWMERLPGENGYL